MLQFSPLLLLQCMFLLSSVTVDGSSVMTGVMMCKRWCERRSWCSEATYDSHSLQCSTEKKTPRLPGLTVIHVQQNLCETCPQHHVCLRTRTGAIKCVKEDTTSVSIKDIISWTNEANKPMTTPGPNTHSSRMSFSGKQSKGDTKKICYGKIRYVELQRPFFADDAVYYDIFAECLEDEQLKHYDELIGPFELPCFKERKIYYWVMTLEIDQLGSLKDTKKLSFDVGVVNAKKVPSNILKRIGGFKGFTITVGRKRITFKSYKARTYLPKTRSRGPYRYVVALDKIKGRMFLGTRKACYVMEDGIDVTHDQCPVVIYPRGHSPTKNKMLFDSIRGREYNFTHTDVKTLMLRCVHNH